MLEPGWKAYNVRRQPRPLEGVGCTPGLGRSVHPPPPRDRSMRPLGWAKQGMIDAKRLRKAI